MAFLSKIRWRLILNPESLLASVMRDKYYPGKTFREAIEGRMTSWGWKGILEARKVLNNGMVWWVGDKTSINIIKDHWFSKPTIFHVRPRENLNASFVCDLINPVSRIWDVDLIEVGFNYDKATVIQCILVIWGHYGAHGEQGSREEMEGIIE
ncbi:hypothetical protein ACFX1Z_037450 [Malus domestica]